MPNPHCPRGLKGGLRILVGMLVELISEGNATQPKAKLQFVNLPSSVVHQRSPLRDRTRTTGAWAGSNTRNLERDSAGRRCKGTVPKPRTARGGRRPRNPSILEDFPY